MDHGTVSTLDTVVSLNATLGSPARSRDRALRAQQGGQQVELYAG